MSDRLKLREVRDLFRLIGDVRAAGAESTQWRTLMIVQLRRLFDAEMVISSEVHVRAMAVHGAVRVVDLGWGCDGGGEQNVWRIHTESQSRPEEYLLSLMPGRVAAENAGDVMPIRYRVSMRAGQRFVLSQCMLPHLGAVDQLGLHKDDSQPAFTGAQHRLIRLFHRELGRIWRQGALEKARDPNSRLPLRLAQTLQALQEGCSEKQVSLRLGISQHTVHNYVKALHGRFGVSSRSELLTKTLGKGNFVPRFGG